MIFNSLIPELTVKDIDATKVFYTEILPFQVVYERVEDKFLFLSFEGNQLMFEQENGNWNTGELEYPFGRGVNFEMTVSDIEGLYRQILNARIEPFRELTTSHYRTDGEYTTQNEFLIQDPDGYLLRFTD